MKVIWACLNFKHMNAWYHSHVNMHTITAQRPHNTAFEGAVLDRLYWILLQYSNSNISIMYQQQKDHFNIGVHI